MEELIRTEMIIGLDNLNKLEKSKVCILGLGGVGGTAFESIVRGGVGEVTIVDNDVFSLSNLNRQILSSYDSLGKAKVLVAFERGKSINKRCKINYYNEFIDELNIKKLIPLDTDIVIDAIDSRNSKIQVIKYCKDNNIEIISSMGTGNKMDPTKLKIMDIYETKMCPLAKIMRQSLRKEGIDSLKVISSDEKPIKPETFLNDSSDELSIKKKSPGSMSYLPPISGYMMGGYAINYLIKNK